MEKISKMLLVLSVLFVIQILSVSTEVEVDLVEGLNFIATEAEDLKVELNKTVDPSKEIKILQKKAQNGFRFHRGP